jgi:hypothetical protein
MKILSRDEFRESVLKRDNYKCVACGLPATAVHHIIDRSLFPDGGYYLDNGASLCDSCHIKAEKGILTCVEIRRLAGISEIVLPDAFDSTMSWDKWGHEIVEERLYKYPRTRHVISSGLQKNDEDDYATIEELKDKHLVIEEKIDGGNTAVSFMDAELKLQCRGHFLGYGNDWPEFDQFKVWSNTWQEQFFDILEDRYIMYGEWISGFHSVFYDLLPHYFMEFDIYDKKEKVFLDTTRRNEMASKADVLISQVRVITGGKFDSIDDIVANVGLSAFISEDAYSILERELTLKNVVEKDVLLSFNKDRLMEGLYIKWEEDGIVKGRYKYVRPGFVQTILDSGEHWQDRPAISNRLKEGCSLFAIKI